MIITSYLLAFITGIIVIFNTRSSTKALAYLFLVFTFPVLGMIVYYTVGVNYRSHKMYSKKLEIDKVAYPKLRERIGEFSKNILNKNKKRLKHFSKLVHLDNLENQITINNKTKLLINGEQKFEEVIKALQKAKHHIHIEYYIYENDTIGNQIAEILKEKAQDGVKIKFIYDDFGSRSIHRKLVKDLKTSGVEVFPFYKYWWHVFASRVNYRNHRKIIIVDGELGFVGGINISDRYINPNTYNLFWRDTHLKIEGPAVLMLQRTFIGDWNFCSNQKIGVTEEYFPIRDLLDSDSGEELVQIVASGPDSDHPNILYSIIQAIMASKEEILITTPYFVPDDSLISALKIAKLSGVNLKLLVPGISDSKIVNSVSHSFYDELLDIGIEIYKYQKGFIHAKTMVCDSRLAIIGTANLDQRSFDLNFEINALVFNEKLAMELSNAFYDDLNNAIKIDPITWKNRPYTEKFIERVARLISPMF
ncbi:cardiolipin synthase [Flavobacteriaceae bacterium R38]|nr:cardiolipin synthase [Flavobacteriaceae bacterium R38]